MALSALDFPADIRWERVCVTEDMLDAAGGDGDFPPRWQSSMAVFRYVPEEAYQNYPGRRIVYVKVTCTITSYQPQIDEVTTAVAKAGVLATGEIQDLDRKLRSYAPCHGAILQVAVTPKEDGVALADYPYVADVQPKQRTLYEQVTDTDEVASRSLESLNVSKGGGASQSQEVLDIDKGTSVSGQANVSGSYAGVGAGVGLGGSYSRSGEWGTRTLGQQDRNRVETTDTLREARETSSHTTQLSQMWTLLQAYHVGTNRVMFYVSPRPHVAEKASGFIRGPRELDGVQEFFLIVNQDEKQELPCVTVRLDTGHLTVTDDMDYDYSSEAPKELSVDVVALPPGELDPNKLADAEGGDPFFSANYDCFMTAPVTGEAGATAPAGFEVFKVVDVGTPASNRGSTELTIDSTDPAHPRWVKLTGTTTGRACYRNSTGDTGNAAALILTAGAIGGPIGFFAGIGMAAGGSDAPGFEESKDVQVGYVRRTVRVHWRSEARTIKKGERQTLLVTSRVLRCCGEDSTPPRIVSVIPLDVDLEYAAPPPVPGEGAATPAMPGMSMRAANELGARAFAETARVADAVADPSETPALDQELAVVRLLELAVQVPRLRRVMTRPAESIDGLDGAAAKRLREAALVDSPAGAAPNRLTVAATPTAVLADTLGLDEGEVLQLRLAALGIGEAPQRERPARKAQRKR